MWLYPVFEGIAETIPYLTSVVIKSISSFFSSQEIRKNDLQICHNFKPQNLDYAVGYCPGT
jgi:hypothetical protein